MAPRHQSNSSSEYSWDGRTSLIAAAMAQSERRVGRVAGPVWSDFQTQAAVRSTRIGQVRTREGVLLLRGWGYHPLRNIHPQFGEVG